MTTVTRFLQKPTRSSFVFGPRGTGKSTWVRRVLPEAPILDLLDRESYRVYAARPERLRDWVLAQSNSEWVVIDEVQRVPELLDVVHQLIEERRGVNFLLTGSSARKLRRSGVNLLAGRASVLTLHPFVAAELGKSFDLEKALTSGVIPLIYSAAESREALQAYLEMYIEQEVKVEALVRNVGDFARFIEVMTFSYGSQLNLSQVARECQIGRNTAQGYLSVLEDLLLCFSVPVFNKRAKRILVNQPKFYFFDCGIFAAVRPRGPLDVLEERSGLALEGLVAQHLRAWIAYRRGEKAELFFWRTKSGSEVDFVVYGGDVFVAIEVKNSRNIYNRDVRALKAFQSDYPEAQAVVVYRGGERIMVDGILCVPCEEFLMAEAWGRGVGRHLHHAVKQIGD